MKDVRADIENEDRSRGTIWEKDRERKGEGSTETVSLNAGYKLIV